MSTRLEVEQPNYIIRQEFDDVRVSLLQNYKQISEIPGHIFCSKKFCESSLIFLLILRVFKSHNFTFTKICNFRQHQTTFYSSANLSS